MVDLAFLLVTFFMLTTTFSKPTAMNLNMPEPGKGQPVPESRTTTIVLGEKDQLFYYTGLEAPEIRQTDYSANGIRKVINDRLRTVPKGPIFIIKAMNESRYQNMVDILDEMLITGAQTYSMVDITPPDIELVKQYQQENYPAE